MAAIDLLMTLNNKVDSAEFELSSGNVIRAFLDPVTPGTGTLILYDPGDGTTEQITVEETPATVATLSQMLIIIAVAGSNQYIHADRITLVLPSGSGSKIYYWANGMAPLTITSTDAPSVIKARVAAVVAEISGEYVDLTTNQNVGGVKTFTNTTDSTTKDTGGLITEGGVGIEKSLFAGFSINAGTSLSAATTVTAGTQMLVSGTTDQLRLGVVGANDIIISAPAPAADSVYTIPDAGVAASFVMTESAQTINGAKTFGTGIALPDGLVSALSVRVGADGNNGLYGISDTQLGVAVEGVLVAGFNTVGFFTDVIAEQTATVGVTVDGLLIKDGGASANSMFAGFFPTAAQQLLAGAGAANVTSYLTNLDTNGGAAAVTLAAGGQIGQHKKIVLTVDGGDATLTLTGYTSIVFNDATDYVVLMWNGAAWFVLENVGTTVNV